VFVQVRTETEVAMGGLINQIRSWASAELKYWEQAALETIASGKELTPEDLRQLTTYFMEDYGLAPTGLKREQCGENPGLCGPPFAPNQNGKSWGTPVSGVGLVHGFLVGTPFS
jgi:hypothetical protein